MKTFLKCMARSVGVASWERGRPRPLLSYKTAGEDARAPRTFADSSDAPISLIALALIVLCSYSARADVTLTETRRKFEGAERTVVHMENERIVVEVVPELEGRVIKYADKSKPHSGFEWLDDCPYHYGGRWEGEPFSYKVDAKGPDRAAITVSGGGKIAVALLRKLTGVDIANPIDLKVERTMSIVPNSTRLQIDVKITNAGEGVAPQFRYMVHAVFGQVPPMTDGRAFWFLPTGSGVEFFDSRRGEHEMGIAGGGAPVDHPFSRFVPGRQADKPRYSAGGWGALLTSAGPVYIEYDARRYDFMQYWFGGDAEWHYTFEPHTRPIDLKPGESTSCSYALAYDSKEVAFTGTTAAFAQPVAPEVLPPGAMLKIQTRGTTVRDRSEKASLRFDAYDRDGHSLFSKEVSGDLQPFEMTDLSAEMKLPDSIPLGVYKWKISQDAKELASGQFEIVTADEQAKRQTLKATAVLQERLNLLQKELSTAKEESRRVDDLWKQGADLALSWNDPRFWPSDHPAGAVVVGSDPAGVLVLGDWKSKEAMRIKTLAGVASPAWPADPEKLLAKLGADRAMLRDVTADADGNGLVALLVDSAKPRVEIIHLASGGAVRRFGKFSDKPLEDDASLGTGARAIAVDSAGNVWVATNAWGKVSVLRINQDGAPYEEAVVGAKGALKKFSAQGNLLGAIGLLTAPADLKLALADGVPVILAPYRHVSTYHDSQLREGVMVIGVADVKRMAEIKMPGASIALDKTGRLWSADVAGHVACFDAQGHKLFDVAGTPPPAVIEAMLPANSPPPVVLCTAPDGVYSLWTLKRTIAVITGPGAPANQNIPADTGALWRIIADAKGAVVVGEKSVWISKPAGN